MFHIILYEPEIPPNTGNIIRLSANSGAQLHLIKPYGFELSDKHLKRAGLDYHTLTFMHEYDSLSECIENNHFNRIFSLSTKGHKHHATNKYETNDAFLFGPETRGLPDTILEQFKEDTLRIPMKTNSRSLNLSNSVAIVLYEALRQQGFAGLS